MQKLKIILAKNFSNLAYFYSHLRYRIFILFALSFLVGLMDGFGLTMFIPLLESVSNNGVVSQSDQLGNLSVLTGLLSNLGFTLTLNVILVIMLAFFILKGVFKFIEQYLSSIYRQYFIKNLRIDSIESLSHLDFEYFITTDVGRIQNTVTGETGRVVQGFNTYMYILQQFILLLVYAFLALIANPEFAILVSVGALVTNVIFNRLYKITKKLSTKFTELNHGFQGLIIQQVAQFKYLKATASINAYTKKIINKINQLEKNQLKSGFIAALSSGLREPIIMFLVVAAILVQVNFMGGKLGAIILSILFFYRALSSIMIIQTSWNKYMELSGSFENIKLFLKEMKRNTEKKGTETFHGFKDKLQLKELQFDYNGHKVLKNIDLTIHKNETIAFIGESGSGKTTLINILTGLLKPKSGLYNIDEQDSQKIEISKFQQKIGYITQEPVIFNDTIFNNVTFWAEKTDKNFQKFQLALQQANIKSFVEGLPLNEETLLGNNGINISGGQKQRLSIARELYKGADILLLDEATSSLDTETEKKIQESFENLKGLYTLVIIAHRLSTVKNADRIILLANGAIDQIGTFDELMISSPAFQKMVKLQHI